MHSKQKKQQKKRQIIFSRHRRNVDQTSNTLEDRESRTCLVSKLYIIQGLELKQTIDIHKHTGKQTKPKRKENIHHNKNENALVYIRAHSQLTQQTHHKTKTKTIETTIAHFSYRKETVKRQSRISVQIKNTQPSTHTKYRVMTTKSDEHGKKTHWEGYGKQHPNTEAG